MNHSWIRIKCIENSLGQVINLKNINAYEELVKPLNHEFDLEKGNVYVVVGLEMWKGTPWIYVVPDTCRQQDEIQIVPAVFFEFDWQDIPNNWCIKMDGEIEGNLEILPKFLSSVPHWFERYVDEDAEIVSLLRREILNASPELDAPKPKDPYAWPFEEYK